MLPNLDTLNKFNKDSPNMMDYVYFLFWSKGIGFNEFNELPIPYILSVLDTYIYKKKQEEKEIKRMRKKR